MSDASPQTPADSSPGQGYQIAIRVAAVAGVFVAIVCGLLLLDYARRTPSDPLETETFEALRQTMLAVGDDRFRMAEDDEANANLKQETAEALTAQLAAIDKDLNERHLRHRRLASLGAVLAAVGVIVLLLAARTAAALRRRLPMPEPAGTPRDVDTRTGRFGRLAVAALAGLLVLTTVTLGLTMQNHLPGDVKQIAQLKEEFTVPAEPTPEPNGTADPPQPAESAFPPLPTEEEIAAGWLQFRGPGGAGVSPVTNVPTTWDAATGQGILWKTPVPLEGLNSPIVCGKYVFLCGATDAKREVYCFDADSGKVLWQREVTPENTADPPEPQFTGFAAPTMTTDGRLAFAMFANGDLVAYDYTGELVWNRNFEVQKEDYGHSASLAMHENRLFVQIDQETPRKGLSHILALDPATGKTLWDVPRETGSSWASPIVARVGDADQLIVAGDKWLISYNPVDGKEIWRAKAYQGEEGISPVCFDGVVYVGNEYDQWRAIRADGTGDVSKTHVVWTGDDGLPDTCSPLVTQDFVMLMPSSCMFTCYDRATGEYLWDEEFEVDESFTSSPAMAGDNVYVFENLGKAWAVQPTREGVKRIGEGDLGEGCVTCPAFADGRLYIRGEKHLFCIGEK
ncbi:MAG: PQQ-binding-like beta-propeller repeat protein [Planctomycetes bacterium]|nr:PQQ-binding-like beta-propeller repeat protein [Planctomycetota bacterium]